MSKDYIPDPDGDFHAWEQNFTSYVTANAASLGLTPDNLAALTAAQPLWDTAFAENTAAQNAAHAATGRKCQTRAAYESAIRTLVRQLQASPAVTDEQRRQMGITVKDPTATPTGSVATRPVAIVNTKDRLRHEIRFFDEATPTRRAKPAGIMGCEIWSKVGEAPADGNDLTFLSLDTASPYLAEYTGEQAGKVAYYMLRWVTTRGEKGPWSETVAATIPA